MNSCCSSLCCQFIFPSDRPKAALPENTLNDTSVLQGPKQAEGRGTIKSRDRVFSITSVLLARKETASTSVLRVHGHMENFLTKHATTNTLKML